MTASPLIGLVDQRDFRRLFIDELGWENPNQPDKKFEIGGRKYVLSQVAGYRGLRIWYCGELPGRKVQREIDALLAKGNLERLVIFADSQRQEWRWPRRAETGGVNAKLLAHRHVVGDPDPHLTLQLEAIRIDFDDEPTLVEVLSRMRAAFNAEAETASVAAARLMGTLYTELENSGISQHDATLLLARLLFLLFGDDGGMWKEGLFHNYLLEYTSEASLHSDLQGLFSVLDTPERSRNLPPGHPYENFRYINGGLYRDPLTIKPLTQGFRVALLAACDFDWAHISPAVFGSMFQTVKNKESRRHGGEHYTTEENILKTIGPLFLDEFKERLDAGWDDKAQLTRLHNDLGRLRFLDPACGCGNFLIVAYRELRALELEVLKRRRDLDILTDISAARINRTQMSLDVTGDIKVTLDHFYGIEIEEWPARIAETAMLLVDHLANQNMEEEFGAAPDRLPIKLAPTIVHGNALRVDWADVVAPSSDTIILGNPPFIGQYTKTAEQTADTRRIWGRRYNGYLDYVTCWYAKALDYYGDRRGRWAFVSTNSICQGEPVEYLWRPILDAGWRCRFAHRSFQWVTEAADGAAVHVSIVGFDRGSSSRPVLWTYPEGGKGTGQGRTAGRINPYLIADAPIVLVSSRTKPLSLSLSPVGYGNKPTDGGHLFVSAEDYAVVASDPIAAKYLRRFVGAKELLHDKVRWCLWLETATQDEIEASPVLKHRVAAVRKMRQDSKKVATQKKAIVAHLFDERRQPSTSYLAIPAHVGEHRRYFIAARYEPDVICGNANFMVEDPNGLILGVLSSSMFVSWMRAIGGRLKSDLRFSNTFTYNSFPLPDLSPGQRSAISAAAGHIIEARASHADSSLASIYDPRSMPSDIIDAHDAVDEVIDKVFGLRGSVSEDERQRLLFRRYAKLTGQELLDF